MSRDAEAAAGPKRCAIYTRTSTDEALAMAFNSLDAQREACDAYIASQRHEGWVLVPVTYSDGGYSGGSLERPALKRLLADIAARKVDTVVVYKIDRLTRSLADFAPIVDILDSAKASFVSVTQAFNTTTSMGRLTLNVLLSFAQFEREVGAERVRDKIAASKAKGMWMGGVCPLGYDVHDRKLIVNESEALTVRLIFDLYAKLGSVIALELELRRRDIVSKLRARLNGSARGGQPFTRGALYALLQNRLYLGQICHRGTAYPGQNEAIVQQRVFDKAQAILERNRAVRRLGSNAEHPSLLAGLVWDQQGRRMSPSHTSKGPRRYRYYASPEVRVPAADLEQMVVGRVAGLLSAPHAIVQAMEPLHLDAVDIEAVLFAAREAQRRLVNDEGDEPRHLLQQVVERIEVLATELRVLVRPAALVSLAGLAASTRMAFEPLELMIPAKLIRRAREVRLAILAPDAPPTSAQDPGLIKLITKAHIARAALLNGGGRSLHEVAHSNGYEPDYFAVLVKLGYLAPDIIAAILEGRHPPTLTGQRLARLRNLPMGWGEQRALLGLAGQRQA